jgi:hypothetical protein
VLQKQMAGPKAPEISIVHFSLFKSSISQDFFSLFKKTCHFFYFCLEYESIHVMYHPTTAYWRMVLDRKLAITQYKTIEIVFEPC